MIMVWSMFSGCFYGPAYFDPKFRPDYKEAIIGSSSCTGDGGATLPANREVSPMENGTGTSALMAESQEKESPREALVSFTHMQRETEITAVYKSFIQFTICENYTHD